MNTDSTLVNGAFFCPNQRGIHYNRKRLSDYRMESVDSQFLPLWIMVFLAYESKLVVVGLNLSNAPRGLAWGCLGLIWILCQIWVGMTQFSRWSILSSSWSYWDRCRRATFLFYVKSSRMEGAPQIWNSLDPVLVLWLVKQTVSTLTKVVAFGETKKGPDLFTIEKFPWVKAKDTSPRKKAGTVGYPKSAFDCDQYVMLALKSKLDRCGTTSSAQESQKPDTVHDSLPPSVRAIR